MCVGNVQILRHFIWSTWAPANFGIFEGPGTNTPRIPQDNHSTVCLCESKQSNRLGAVAHTCNASTLGLQANAGGSLEAWNLKSAWATYQDTICTKKNVARCDGICLWAPATHEVEVGDCLSWGVQGWGELWSHRCIPAWLTKWDPISKKVPKKRKEKKNSLLTKWKYWTIILCKLGEGSLELQCSESLFWGWG